MFSSNKESNGLNKTGRGKRHDGKDNSEHSTMVGIITNILLKTEALHVFSKDTGICNAASCVKYGTWV